MAAYPYGGSYQGPNGFGAAWGGAMTPYGGARGAVVYGPNGGYAARGVARGPAGSAVGRTWSTPNGNSGSGGHTYNRSTQTLDVYRQGTINGQNYNWSQSYPRP